MVFIETLQLSDTNSKGNPECDWQGFQKLCNTAESYIKE